MLYVHYYTIPGIPGRVKDDHDIIVTDRDLGPYHATRPSDCVWIVPTFTF